MSKKKGCKFCTQKVVDPKNYMEGENQIEIANGCWIGMYIGVNSNGDIVMRACADDYTDDYFPSYCPECGRKLQKI